MTKLKDKKVSATLAILHQKAEADRLLRQEQRENAPDNGEVAQLDRSTAYLAIGPEEGEFLYFLATLVNAKSIVEFGCSFGISTIYLAAAASDNGGEVITSDFQETKVVGAKENLQEAGLLEWVEIRQGDALQTLASVGEGIDFLFLDGAKELYLPIFEMLRPNLSSGAIVFADNADHKGSQSFIRHMQGLEAEFSTVYLFDGRVFIAHLL